LLAISMPLFAACGGDDEGNPDAAPGNPDARENPDALENADAAPPDAAIPPEAPTVTTPSTSDQVFSPVRVEGSAEANATVHVVVIDDGFDVGNASGSADGSGDFSLSVGYTNADADDPLTIRVTQESRGMVSDPTDVAVTQLAVFELSGNIDQAADGSSFAGTVVKVRLYDSDTKVLDFIQEVEITATDGLILTSTPFTFEVPDGTFWIRAFRDSDSMGGAGPDGHPTMWYDPQVPGTQATVSGANSTGNDITLANTISADGYQGFNVYAMNESYMASPPQNDTNFDGPGLCRGYYMRMVAYATDGNESAAFVRVPGGGDLQLFDDGGCGHVIANNTNQSYDDDAGDSSFSRGIPNPTTAQAGDYVLYFRDTALDVVHSEVDNIHTVLKLSRRVPTLSPTGAAAETDVTPTITWDAVPDADLYDVWIMGRDYNNGEDPARPTTTTSYTVSDAQQLVDDEPYVVAVVPEAFDPVVDEDVDAIAVGIMNFFVVDVAGDSTVTLSGSLDNQSGETGDYLILGLGYEMAGWLGPQSSLLLPSDATSYSLAVFSDPFCPLAAGDGAGQVAVMVDVDDSADFDSLQNAAYLHSFHNLEVCDDVTGLDASFTPPVVVTYPTADTTGAGDTPNMQWENYADTYQAATGTALSTELSTWSYVWYANERGGSGDFPVVLWGLPNTATNFDLANPPAGTDAFDVLTLMSSTSAANLSSSTTWQWAVLVVDCDYDEYLSGDPLVYTNCLQALVDSQGSDSFARSGEIPFDTD